MQIRSHQGSLSGHVECLQRVRDIQRNGRSTLAARWKILDRTFLKPLFGGRERLAADGVQGYPLGPDGMDGDDSDDSGDAFELGTGCVVCSQAWYFMAQLAQLIYMLHCVKHGAMSRSCCFSNLTCSL